MKTRLLPLVVLGGASLLAAPAAAEVTKPFPGVTLVTRPGSALVIADLCTSGVSVRATKYAERRRTPESWANLVGAEVAINADFFDFPAATLADGRARGGGEDWPADKNGIGLATRGEDRHYWQFGALLGAEPVEPTSRPPSAASVATEIVGGHNVLVRNGVSLAPNFDGDAVLVGTARRTAIGTNKDRSLLYLFTTNNVANGTTLTNALLAHAAEGGAPSIDFASNLDGGGSSQMFDKGRGQIVTSGRLVANHVGVMAKGSGPAPMCPGKRPVGFLDAADCNHVAGWSIDPDEPTKSVGVTLVYDALFPDPKMKVVEIAADAERPDLQKPYGSTKHGFDVFPPLALFDGKPHPVWAIGKDSAGGRSTLLEGSKSITCPPSPPTPSIKRHVVDATTLDAWRFVPFVDQLTLPDDVLASLTEDSAALVAPPVLVRSDDGTYYVVDRGSTRRRLLDSRSVAAWRLDLTKASVKSDAELRALTGGPPMRARPMLAKASGPAVYLVDAPASEADDADPLLTNEEGQGGQASSGGASGASDRQGSQPGAEDAAGEGCTSSPRRGGEFALLGLGAIVFAWARRRRAMSRS